MIAASSAPRSRGDALGRREVVEGRHQDALQRRPGGCRRCPARGSGYGRLGRHPPVPDHGVVVEAVPAALELQDLLAAREGPGHAAGEHRGLGPGGDEAHLLRARDGVDDRLRQADRRLGEPVEGRPSHDLLLDRPDHRRVRVARGAAGRSRGRSRDRSGRARPRGGLPRRGRRRTRARGAGQFWPRHAPGRIVPAVEQQLAGPALQRFEFDRHREAPSLGWRDVGVLRRH